MREGTPSFDSPDDEVNLGYRCLRVRTKICVSLAVVDNSSCIIAFILGETVPIRGSFHSPPALFFQNVKANSLKQCEPGGRSRQELSVSFMLEQWKAAWLPVVVDTTFF